MQIAQSLNAEALHSVSSCLKSSHFVWGPWTRRGSTRSLQNLLQGENVRFEDEHSVFPGILRRSLVFAVIPVMLYGHAFNSQLESELGLSFIGPIPQGLFSYSAHDLRCLMNVQVSACFVDVRFELCHPETKPDLGRDFKDFVSVPDRGFCQHFCDQADGFYE